MEGAMFFFSPFDDNDIVEEGVCFGIGEYRYQSQKQEKDKDKENEE